MALNKKVYGVNIWFSALILAVYGIFTAFKKAENPLCPNQKLATSLDLSCRESLSAISAINSEFVGFPLVLLTV